MHRSDYGYYIENNGAHYLFGRTDWDKCYIFKFEKQWLVCLDHGMTQAYFTTLRDATRYVMGY